ncbi:MAG: Gx transporter family protein, partial [Oscillospiraceae bacterium]|nr:Gx transporter family protein [Oscillospiraceae bacterium]
MKNINAKTRQTSLLGMMLAMIVVLSALEHALPPIPGLPPNMRLGLSNVVTMYAIFFVGYKQAFLLAVLKSMFVMSIRGGIAGVLSFSGGMLAVLGIVLLAHVFG